MQRELNEVQTHHSHLGKVEQTFWGVIRSSFLDEGQVCEVHSDVWNAWRVASIDGVSHVAESAVGADQILELVDGRFGLIRE